MVFNYLIKAKANMLFIAGLLINSLIIVIFIASTLKTDLSNSFEWLNKCLIY